MNVLITGGGTTAPIDDVRGVSNASTGRFSAEIAEACLRRGATVWHVHAPSAQRPFFRSAALDLATDDPDAEFARLHALRREYRRLADRLHLRPFAGGTVASYEAELRAALASAPIDVAFLAAAVSDFEPEATPGKIDSDRTGLDLRMKATPKLIRSVRDWSPTLFLVGFKLLSGSRPDGLIASAVAATRTNRADLTAANDLATVRAGRHEVHVVDAHGPIATLGPGGGVAEALVDLVFERAARKRAGG